MASVFKAGSQPDRLNNWFKQGKSLTHEEAIQKLDVHRLAQRMNDLKNKYLEYTTSKTHPIMVIYEDNQRGGKRARYFYRGVGCPLEHNSKAKEY